MTEKEVPKEPIHYIDDHAATPIEFSSKKFHNGPDLDTIHHPAKWKNVFLLCKNVRTDARKNKLSLDTINIMRFLIINNIFKVYGNGNGFSQDFKFLSDAKHHILKSKLNDKNWTSNAPEETDIEILIQNTRYFENPSEKRSKIYAQRAGSFREAILQWKWPSNEWKPLTLKTPVKNKNKNNMTTPRTFVTSSDDENDNITSSKNTNKKGSQTMTKSNKKLNKVCPKNSTILSQLNLTLHFT